MLQNKMILLHTVLCDWYMMYRDWHNLNSLLHSIHWDCEWKYTIKGYLLFSKHLSDQINIYCSLLLLVLSLTIVHLHCLLTGVNMNKVKYNVITWMKYIKLEIKY